MGREKQSGFPAEKNRGGKLAGPRHSEIPPWPKPAYAWYVVGVLTLAYTVSFVDRQILALLVGPIRRDLQITDTQISLLQGFAFALLYTVLGLPIGRLADHRSRRGIIAVGIAVWSLMTVFCGMAKSFWTLFLARTGVGIGEAALSPPAYSIVADYFPPERLAKALSFYSMGIYIGAGLAFIVGGGVVALVSETGQWTLPVIGTIYPWQITFIVVGLPGFLVVALMATIKEPVRRGLLSAAETKASTGSDVVPMREVISFVLKRWRTFGPHFFGISMMSLMGYGTGAWLPEYAIRTFGTARSEIAVYYGIVILVFATSGIVFAGWLAEKLMQRGYKDANLRIIIGVALLTTPLGIMAPLAPNLGWLAILGIPVVFMAGMPFGIGPAALQVIVPNQMRAQISAMYLFVINIIGLGFGPTFVALITDKVFGYDGALKYSLSILHGTAAPIAAFVLWFGLKHYRESYGEATKWHGSSAGAD